MESNLFLSLSKFAQSDMKLIAFFYQITFLIQSCARIQISILKMSFKATFDIAVNFSYFKIKDFHKSGSIYHKTQIYYINGKDSQKNKKNAFPFNFVQYNSQRDSQSKQNNLINLHSLSQAYISEDQINFISRSVPVNYMNSNFIQNTTCYFKLYVDVEKIEQIQFFIQVQFIYRPIATKQGQITRFLNTLKQQQQVISTFKGKINKSYDIFAFLPISFDEFQSIKLNATYHSVISQFTFTNEEQQQQQKIQTNGSFFSFYRYSGKLAINSSFKDYLDKLTQGFLSSKIKTFYKYYMVFLINTYNNLCKRQSQFGQVLVKGTKTKQYNKKDNDWYENLGKKVQKQLNLMYLQPLNVKRFEEQKQILSELILWQFSVVKQKIYEKWASFNTLIEEKSYQVIQKELKNYNQLIQQRYKNNIFSHNVKMEKNRDFTYSRYDDSGKSHIQQARRQNEKRTSQGDVWTDKFPIQDMWLVQKQQSNIKIFEQIYQIDSQAYGTPLRKQSVKYNVNHQSLHIIFLIHGMGASRIDMLLLKNYIQQKYAHVQAIISVQNSGHTANNLQKLGVQLAEEVQRQLTKIKQTQWRLSFIGHSMGGLIVRSALTKLSKYKQRLYSYISICTPHLGFLYEPSSLIKIGLWVIGQIQKSDSLNQIEMKDNPNLRECYLYSLSKSNSLSYFKNVVFIASSQDQYVPYESARIQKSPRLLSSMSTAYKQKYSSIKQMFRSSIVQQMINNILRTIKEAKQISRINVVFNIERSFSFEALIGREGHVRFLRDDQWIREWVSCFGRFF